MLRNGKRMFGFLLAAVAALLCVGIVLYQTHLRSLDSQVAALESLGTGVSVQQLKTADFVDVTETADAANPEIARFLAEAAAGRGALLKTCLLRDGNLFVTLYYSDPELKRIRSWTYEPWKQAGDDPDRRFSTVSRKSVENGRVNVVLTGVKNDSIPSAQTPRDEILYSYRK